VEWGSGSKLKLKDHIDKAHKGRNILFAQSMGVDHQQVSRWLKYGCIWHDGAVWKRQSKPVADGTMNAFVLFAGSSAPVEAKLALVEGQLLMQIPNKNGSKLVVVEVHESIAAVLAIKETFTEPGWPDSHDSDLTYDEFLDKYRIYSDVPYNAKDAF
jgi:hypothetical protein